MKPRIKVLRSELGPPHVFHLELCRVHPDEIAELRTILDRNPSGGELTHLGGHRYRAVIRLDAHHGQFVARLLTEHALKPNKQPLGPRS